MIDKHAMGRGFLHTDVIEAVTFRPKTAASVWSTTGYKLYRAERSYVNKTVTDGGGLIQRQDIVFRIHADDLPLDAPDPKMNDRIEDSDGILYGITDGVDVVKHGKVFVCHCQKLVS